MRLRLLTLSLLLVLAGSPGKASAWESLQRVVHGSANVMEKGETMMGVLTPLAYGVHDRITLFTHPALHLLLTPNVWARGALKKGRTALALEGGYQQTFFAISQTGTGDNQTYPGYVQAGAVFTHTFTDWLQLNLAGGYIGDMHSGQEDQLNWSHSLYLRTGVTFLFARKTFIFTQVRIKAVNAVDFERPTAWLLFGRHTGRMRFGVGVCIGNFVLGNGEETVAFVPDEVPVYPWADVWWRF